MKRIKPVLVSSRSVPYNLQARVADSIENLIQNGVIEEHPSNELMSWVSYAVIVQEDDGSLGVTLDACNLNKALISTNCSIPKQRILKLFHQVQRVSANWILNLFWKLELHPDSRYFIIMHANNIVILILLWDTILINLGKILIKRCIKTIFGTHTSCFSYLKWSYNLLLKLLVNTNFDTI